MYDLHVAEKWWFQIALDGQLLWESTVVLFFKEVEPLDDTQHPHDTHVTLTQHPYNTNVTPMWHLHDTHVTPMWHLHDTHVINDTLYVLEKIK